MLHFSCNIFLRQKGPFRFVKVRSWLQGLREHRKQTNKQTNYELFPEPQCDFSCVIRLSLSSKYGF